MVWVIQGTVNASTTATINVPSSANFRRMRITTDNIAYVNVPSKLFIITKYSNLTTYENNKIYVNGELDIKFHDRQDGTEFVITIQNPNTIAIAVQIILDE